jgi:hypothetical protein
VSLLVILLPGMPAFGRRHAGTRVSSDFGGVNDQSSWELQTKIPATVDNISIMTEVVCPGGFSDPLVCGSQHLFLYQIPSGKDRLVVTFSGLSEFALATPPSNQPLSFGVLLCDPAPDPANYNMLCTQNVTAQQLAGMNIGWDAIGGDLVFTIPSIPMNDNLTLFVLEGPAADGTVPPLLPPAIHFGGAVVIPPGLTFGSQETGKVSTPQTVTVENSGDFSSNLNVSGLSTPTNFTTAGSCSALTPGENCALFVSFSPTATGSSSGNLNLTDDSPATSEAISLTGQGDTPGVTLSPSNLIYGSRDVGTQGAPASVAITNAPSNSQALQISDFVISTNPVTGQADFTETDNCTGAAIAPGSSCQAQISFFPSISGPISASIKITDNSSDGFHTIALQGNGTDPESAAADHDSLSFGNQFSGTASDKQMVTVTNAGLTALNVAAVTATAGFAISSENCSTSGPLSAGANCTLSVVFNPAQPGTYTGTVTIADDAVGGMLVLPLTGVALSPPPAAATPTFSLASGSYTSAQSVTISDTTPAAAIYFTADGTAPTPASTLYSGPITISASETLQAIATAAGLSPSAIATAQYKVNIPPPTFAISGTGVTVAPGATAGNASTITVSPMGGFTGSVTLSAAITSSPSGAVNLPTLSFGSTSPVVITGASPATATLTVTTTAPANIAVSKPWKPDGRWLTSSGAFLACILLFDIPMRRRGRRLTLVAFLLLVAFATGFVACGGGGGNPTTGITRSPGTTTGSYTITITGTAGSLTETGTATLVVN